MKLYLSLLLVLVLVGCGAGVDTAKMTADEHFDYAKSLFDEEDYFEALEQLQSVLLQYPANAVADDAQYYLGRTYFMRQEYILAAYEFSKLIKNIPASPFVVDAQYMLAKSYYELSPPPTLDQQYTKKCIEEFQAFIEFFPTDGRIQDAENKIKELNEKLAEKEYNGAVIYEKMEYFNAAIKTHENLIRVYHDSKFAKESLFKKINLLVQKERFNEAIRDIEIYIDRYKDDSRLPELEELKASLLNDLNSDS